MVPEGIGAAFAVTPPSVLGRVHAGGHGRGLSGHIVHLGGRALSITPFRVVLYWTAIVSLTTAPALAQEASRDALPAPAAAPEAVWDGTVELYGYLPWLQSTTTVRGFEAETDLDPAQILQRLQSTFSARASLERRRLGLLVDVSTNQIGAANSRSTRRGVFTGNSEVTSINGVYDVALRWRLGERESAVGLPGSGWLIPYAGMRVVQARLDVAAELRGNGPRGVSLQRQGTLERTWTQPLLGLQGSVFLTPRLRAFARGDLGGFGLAGAEDFSANGQAGVGYAIGNNTNLNVSWRYQGLRWNNGAARSNGFTSDLNGIEVGVKFYF
jgi:opacity protein-like surface antigen